MPRYSIVVTSARDVVVDAATPAQALSRARRYAKDCFPTVSPLVVAPPREVPDSHNSRTSDDEFDIPRDA